MRRRLRKKKRLGEFQELGFEINFHFPHGLATEEQDELLDEWIIQAIERNDLAFGGGFGNGVCNGFITVAKSRGSATEQHRHAVEAWLKTNPKVLSFTMGSLVDAWHGW